MSVEVELQATGKGAEGASVFGEGSGAGQASAAALAGAGAAATSAAAAACCVPVVSPLLVGAVGASGAVWLAGLRPWAPYLLGGAFLLLAYAYWSLRRASRCAPGPGTAGSPAARRRWRPALTRILLAGATVIWLASAVAYALLG